MKCHDAKRLMTELFDVEEYPSTQLVREHLDSCPECRRRFEQERRALEAIRPTQRIVASQSFKEGAMKAIIAEAERESGRPGHQWKWKYGRRWLVAGAAAIAAILVLAVLPIGRWGHSDEAGIMLLAQSVQSMSNVTTVHMVGRMRTLPGDNFELIGTNYKFVPLELWREFTDPPCWRIQKPGRVVVRNGQTLTLYISAANLAMTGSPGAGFVDWLRPLLNPEAILREESAAAREGASDVRLTKADGVITLTVQRSARGNFVNNWMKNKSIVGSDHTCVYRFDAATKRLEGLQVIVRAGSADVTVLEITKVDYNQAFPPSLFSLQLPSNVNWLVNPANLKPAPAELNGPKEVASYFFDALAREDWNAVLQVYPVTRVSDPIKRVYGGLEVISIGEPFRSGLYGGYFVPYEVRLRDGYVKKMKLAVRNDNPAHRWYVDGGF